jgi:hypothetical protein
MNAENETALADSLGQIREGARRTAEAILSLSTDTADWAIHEMLIRQGLSSDLLHWAKEYRDGKLTLDGFAKEMLRNLGRGGSQ